jgi:hypothetical protein
MLLLMIYNENKDRTAKINRTLSGRHDPAMSRC